MSFRWFQQRSKGFQRASGAFREISKAPKCFKEGTRECQGVSEAFHGFSGTLQCVPQGFQKHSKIFKDVKESFWDCPKCFRGVSEVSQGVSESFEGGASGFRSIPCVLKQFHGRPWVVERFYGVTGGFKKYQGYSRAFQRRSRGVPVVFQRILGYSRGFQGVKGAL